MTSTTPTDPAGQRRPSRSLTSRTSLVTAAAIAGVLVAGSAAVAANIGILNAADSSAIGELAATDELLPSADTSTTTFETTTVPSTATAPGPQRYDIESIGSVWVMTTTSGLALDQVVTDTAWTSTLSQGDLRSLRVEFTNSDRTVVFTASLADDGTVAVDVTEPTTVVAGPAAGGSNAVGTTPTTGTYDDDHDDDDHDETTTTSTRTTTTNTKGLMTMTDIDPLLTRRAPPISPRRRPRRHPATGARIAAVGVGLSTMLGLVATMGIASAVADVSATAPSPTDTPQATPVSAAVEVTSTTVPASAPATSELPAMTLTVRPDVRVIAPPPTQAPTPAAAPSPAPAPAPAATTSGSR